MSKEVVFSRKRLILKFKANFGNELFLSVFWGTLAGVISQGLNFVTNILIARILLKDLGRLTILVSANAALQTFTVFGLSTMAAVLIAKRSYSSERMKALIPSMYGLVFINSLLVSVIAVLIDKAGISGFSIWPDLSGKDVSISIIWLLFSSIDALQVGLLVGLNKFKTLALVSLVRGLISILIIFPMVRLYGVNGGVYGYAISFFICSLFSFILILNSIEGLKHRFIPRRIFDKRAFWHVIHYSFPIFIASFFISPSQWLANSIVFSRDTSGLALSTFAIVNQWLILIQFLPAQIARSVLPYMSKQSESLILGKTDRFGLYISLIIAAGICLLSLLFEKIIIGLYGFNYSTTIIPFRIILVTGLLSTFNLLYGQSLVAKGFTWIRTIADMIAAFVLVGFVWFSGSSLILYVLPLAYLLSFIFSSGALVIMKRKKQNNVRNGEVA